MTLGQFLDTLSQNPSMVLFYFLSAPLTAGLAWMFGKGEGHKSPWKYLYSFLVYYVSIPGIFAITLSAYLLFFERKPILGFDMYSQVLPVITMILTLWLIRKNVSYHAIPGFGKVGSLLTIIAVLISIFWILEKTHIFAVTYIPFHYFIILLLIAIILIRISWSRITG